MAFDIRLKRVYEQANKKDGQRIPVERLWPRGVKKEDANFDEWLKNIAPSAELRKWFSHDPSKWGAFKNKYWRELDKNTEMVDEIISICAQRTMTFLFTARDTENNNAVALKEYLLAHNG